MKRYYWFFLSFVLILLFVGGFWLFSKKNNLQVDKQISCSSKVGLNQDICKFLKSESPFSYEDIKSKILVSKRSDSIDRLGLESFSRAEGLFLGYKEWNDSLLVFAGFDGQDGNRFVTPIRIPVYSIKDVGSSVSLIVNSTETNSLADLKKMDRVKNINDMENIFQSLKDKVVVFMMVDDTVSDSQFNKLGETESNIRLLNELNDQVSVSRSFLNRLNGNGLVSQYSDYTDEICFLQKESDINSSGCQMIFPMVYSIMVRSQQ